MFSVSTKGVESSRAEVQEGRTTEERFDSNEHVERDWSEMDIPCGERELISATTSPEVRRAVRNAHHG